MIRALKFRLFNVKPNLTRGELLACVLIILLAAYVLAPWSWEPGGESLKNWGAAQVFRQTGGFPVYHHAPLYNMYLQLFLFFNYPLSIQLEHFVTHLFTYTAIFLLLCRFLPIIPALLLTCAWIPTLWGMEGGARVAGIGFLALYLRTSKLSVLNRGYFPTSLCAAALLDTAFIPFLIGHIIGTGIKRYYHRERLFNLTGDLKTKEIFHVVIIIAMLVLLIFTALFQSKRADNNAFGFISPWAPVAQKEIFTICFFAVGNAKYVIRNIPEPEWIYQDWYLTNKDAFGGAANVFQAILNKPKFVLTNIFSEIPSALMVPAKFIFGFCLLPETIRRILMYLPWIILPICFYKIFNYYKVNDLIPHIYSIVFGTAGVVTALFLVLFHGRYVLALLPVGLLMVAHLGTSVQSGINWLRKSVSHQLNNVFTGRTSPVVCNIFLIFGLCLILLGLIANERMIAPILSLDGHLGLRTKIKIWSIDFLFITCGMFFIIKRKFLSTIFTQIKNRPYSNMQTWFTNAITLLMALCILTSSQPFNQYRGIKSVFHNPFLLSGRMFKAHRQLLASVNKHTKVLAVEMPWIKTFADVDIDKVFHALYLPPFKDSSGETEKFLEGLDVIWVSDDFSRKVASLATQIYLRYELHVAPFLKKALKKGWTVEEVEGFGQIYRRPKFD